MRKRFNTCLLLLLLLGMFHISCVKEVTLDAGEKPQIAVACVLSDDSIQTLHLSFTKGASLSMAPPLTEAIVKLYDNGDEIGAFQYINEDVWLLEYSAIPNHHYRLEIQVPGYELVFAEQTMPEPAPVRCFEYVQLIASNAIQPWTGWIKVPDPVGDHVKYLWPEDEASPAAETYYVRYPTSSAIWIYALNYNPETGQMEIVQDITTDARADPFNVLDKRYDPPERDVQNPYKFSGYTRYDEELFKSAHLMELYPILQDKPIYEKFFRLLPSNGPVIFAISGGFEGKYCSRLSGIWGYAADPAEDEGYLVCVTCSDDYDKYLSGIYYHMKIKASTDLSTIYLRDNLWTNIVGGVGIFGASTERMFPWAETYTYIDSGVPVIDYSKIVYIHQDPPSDPR